MDVEAASQRVVREVFRFDIPSGSGAEIGVLARRTVYESNARQLIEDRVKKALIEALTAARKSD